MNLTDHNRVRGAEGATVVAPALSSNDPRLTQAVEEYLALLRAGQKPTRFFAPFAFLIWRSDIHAKPQAERINARHWRGRW